MNKMAFKEFAILRSVRKYPYRCLTAVLLVGFSILEAPNASAYDFRIELDDVPFPPTAAESVDIRVADIVSAPASLFLDLRFPSSLMNVLSVSAGPTASAAGKTLDYTIVDPNTIRIVIGGVNQNTISEGVVATIHFLVTPGATRRSLYGIHALSVSAADPMADRLTVDTRGVGSLPIRIHWLLIGVLCAYGLFLIARKHRVYASLLFFFVLPVTAISAFVAGDVNESGTLEMTDLDSLINVALGASTDFADIDGSGKVDAVDYQLLVRALLGQLSDSDSDGLFDIVEINLGTDPNSSDTDLDGIEDGEEIKVGTDPASPIQIVSDVIITEFIASNESGLVDEFGEYEDWIELYNGGSTAVNLEGWALTDDPALPDKWVFPSTSLGSGNYLVVFASGRDRIDSAHFHTNFGIKSSGEYLALRNNLGEITSEFSPTFTPQRTDYSFGLFGSGPEFRHFEIPTPGAQNLLVGSAYIGFIEDVVISPARGFYHSSQSLTAASAVPGVLFRYTTDGSEPSASNGILLSGPLAVDDNSSVRIIAEAPGYLSSTIQTHTYFFTTDIIHQSPTGLPPGPGWPSGTVNDQVFDYGMDPDVINDPRYTSLVDDALTAIPSISIVMDLQDLMNPSTGIYANAQQDGRDWERPTSLELINPDGSEGFQINAGIRIRGGASRSGSNPKHSFRFFFRNEYGASKLNFPLFGDEGVDEFDKIDLRTSQGNSWNFNRPEMTTMNRDVFNRDTQRDMGSPYTRSRYYHLYLNGVYWGVYQSQERGEARYAESYFGGANEDYDIVKVNAGSGNPFTVEATDGNLDAWYQLWQEAHDGLGKDESINRIQGLDPDGTSNPTYANLLDIDNLIDYMLVIFYGGNMDAPITWFKGEKFPNNFYAFYNRDAPEGFKSLIHDAENTLFVGDVFGEGDELFRDRTGPFPAGSAKRRSNPQWIHQRLADHPEYRMKFADHAHRHFFNGGTLTPAANDARFMARTNEIDLAIIAESARWGDFKSSPARTKDDDWQPNIDDIRNTYFPNRTAIVIDQFKNKGWYPGVDAPVFNMNGGYQHGGYATAPYSFSMTNPNGSGTVYYTLDGSDPREAGIYSEQSATTFVTEADAKMVLVPADSGDLTNGGFSWTEVAFDDSGWMNATGGVGYDTSSDYDSHIDSNIEADMRNINGTSLIRIPFTLTAPQLADSKCLTLRMKYDDGFIAYINGVEVARGFAPAGASWDSTATASNDDFSAKQFMDFDLNAHVGVLAIGTNVLSIHGLNDSIGSSDFLINAELVGYNCTGPSVAASAIPYGGSFALPLTTHVKARVEDGGEWSALNEATFVFPAINSNLRITEIMYHPVNPDAEFIELKNVGGQSINLINSAFTEGIHYMFADSILAPGEFVVLVKDAAAFESVYGMSVPVAGVYTGSLDNGGERIRLEDPTGEAILDFEFEDSWYPTTDGLGYSLVMISPNFPDTSAWGLIGAWLPSPTVNGAPGE
jgi:hypothetical protein